ncbi:MAG: SRPBCC family protein [Gemmatimonadales bacterium]
MAASPPGPASAALPGSAGCGPPCLWLVGLFLPRHHAESARLELAASPETVWQLLTDLDAMSDWRHDLAGLERLPGGPAAVRWREIRADGRSAALEAVEVVPPVRLVVRPADAAPGSRWVYRLEPLAAGTRLEIREERDIGNPLVRAVVGLVGAGRERIDGLAGDLERRVATRRDQVAAR